MSSFKCFVIWDKQQAGQESRRNKTGPRLHPAVSLPVDTGRLKASAENQK